VGAVVEAFLPSAAAPHLGGDVPGGDPATWFPDLWMWLADQCEARSWIDVGCGDGTAVAFLRSIGVEAWGIDGLPRDDPYVVEHDFTKGGYESASADVVWSSEFLEHVEERYISNLYSVLTAAPVVAITHAFPDQPGHHHVNCQPPAYWRGVFASWGYAVDRHLTPAARNLAARNLSPWNHFTRSGLVFRRIE
jgi:SAM-dependent methyltransferase